MTAINRLYASSGSEVIIGTLQIDIGGQTHYLCGVRGHYGGYREGAKP